MSITNEENSLFGEWKGNRKGFVSDGLISEQDYLNSNTKICILLKEVNDPDIGGWDLREFIVMRIFVLFVVFGFFDKNYLYINTFSFMLPPNLLEQMVPI